MANLFFESSLGASFCDRNHELASLLSAAKNGQSVFIYGQRGIGKTALIRRVMEELKDELLCVYIPLEPWANASVDPATFLAATIINEIVAAVHSKSEVLIYELREDLERFSPIIFWENKTSPPRMKFPSISNLTIDVAFNIWETTLRRQERNGLMVFDDFQAVQHAEKIEPELRSIIQHSSISSYIFLMSNQKLLEKMFFSKANPMYRSGSVMYLRPIERKYWEKYIRSTFHKANLEIGPEHMDQILGITQGHPLPTIMICSWLLQLANARITSNDIDRALDLVLSDWLRYTIAILEGLAPNQKNLLIAIADAGECRPYTRDFMDRYGLKGPSSVQRSLEALVDRDLIEEVGDGNFSVRNPMVRLTLQNQSRKNPLTFS